MSLPYRLWLWLRATAFWSGFVPFTVFYGLLSVLLYVVPGYLRRYHILVGWCSLSLWWLRLTCGVDCKVQGRENIPQDQATIIMANHQSTWETLAFATIFPPLTWVLKRELLKVPFFGWGVRLIKPIAIDRSAGRSAVDQVKVQGKDRLDEDISLVIFPEGTRVNPGESKPYKVGGSVMATYTGYPVLPVAHNAGASWPRMSYIKKPGTITVSIGKPISTRGKEPEVLLKEVETWINAERATLVFDSPDKD